MFFIDLDYKLGFKMEYPTQIIILLYKYKNDGIAHLCVISDVIFGIQPHCFEFLWMLSNCVAFVLDQIIRSLHQSIAILADHFFYF